MNDPLAQRSAGVLLHPTSLPGPDGAGDLGPDAYRFVDMLADAGQSIWQILPLGPPGLGHSPYAARSSFAGDPRLISLEQLAVDGLLDGGQVEAARPSFDPRAIDFDALRAFREPLLRQAFATVQSSGRWTQILGEELHREAWLEDFALFEAVGGHHSGVWTTWPAPIRNHDADALREIRAELAEEVAYHEFLQWCFNRQWSRLKEHAKARNVRILGDIPIFPAYDSADVWGHRDVFKLDEEGSPLVVAGVPPDAFSDTGQRWGNPHYRWDVLESRAYDWWVQRLRRTFDQVDVLRIDHFRGFASAWEIPVSAPTAIEGEWIVGPGTKFFEVLKRELSDLPVVVEDLGVITPDVEELRDVLGLPGMKVLQFAFDGSPKNPYLPHNFTSDSVVYTGTHDNDTTAGWFAKLPQHERDRVLRYLARDGSDPVNDMIRLAYASVSRLAIVPMQDILKLGEEARMNRPGIADGNWGWRFEWHQVDAGQLSWMRQTAELYGRVPSVG